MRIVEFYSDQKTCSYIETKKSQFQYMYIEECRTYFYKGLLQRGWRRFGKYFFVPVCQGCTDCISIRQLVNEFEFTKNHKRVFKKNQSLKILLSRPSVDNLKLALYDKYHRKMMEKKGWDYRGIDLDSYADMFVEGEMDFGFELSYYFDDRLIGVGLLDILLDSMSSIYFFYDHDFLDLSLGTLNILTQIKIAKERGLKYFYPGYWIKDHYCMGYKERFKPFEFLKNAPDLFDEPCWKIYQKENNGI
ncbi:arginyltransferase [Helicobacter cappadocius]|uniref:Aspartate/glutamate leucyltransferase n=1 Tax=Helicobacter cappadocius TaxID=3063998 RepID=A0AA90Q3D2_9HELI|nr:MULTISPECIES: arginyltransferase [unclassified Helicobacter]MDO7253486.1 arginyltransferase [Helicobacter sp. faydin-H75]MDP2539413.1 arginyltransferase [Helicobacter sp. faydin-H76]